MMKRGVVGVGIVCICGRFGIFLHHDLEGLYASAQGPQCHDRTKSHVLLSGVAENIGWVSFEQLRGCPKIPVMLKLLFST
jgi:hypothetical protein